MRRLLQAWLGQKLRDRERLLESHCQARLGEEGLDGRGEHRAGASCDRPGTIIVTKGREKTVEGNGKLAHYSLTRAAPLRRAYGACRACGAGAGRGGAGLLGWPQRLGCKAASGRVRAGARVSHSGSRANSFANSLKMNGYYNPFR